MKMKRILLLIKRGAPLLCALAAAGGVIFTSVTSSKAGEKAAKAKLDAVFAKGSELTKKEEFFVKAPCYILPIVSSALTVGFIFGCHFLNKKAQASIVASAVALEEAFRKYRAAGIQKFGAEFNEAIKEQMIENRLAEAESPQDGLELFYDEITDTIFESTRVDVLQGIIDCHTYYMRGGALGLNEYRELLGMQPEAQYENIGWETGVVIEWLGDYCVDIELSDAPVEKDGKQCTVISVGMEPIIGYQDWDYCDPNTPTVFFPSYLSEDDILNNLNQNPPKIQAV